MESHQFNPNQLALTKTPPITRQAFCRRVARPNEGSCRAFGFIGKSSPKFSSHWNNRLKLERCKTKQQVSKKKMHPMV